MISANPKPISIEKYEMLLQQAGDSGYEIEFQKSNHRLLIKSGEDWLAQVFLPWDCKPDASGLLSKIDDFHLGLVMIRAGIACTGHFHEGLMQDHKVFRAYMVRQKQGKSQLKYLKTKGKSRAGSRLRLGESERFFEEINQRLQQYEENYAITTWGISCGKTLWPYFFGGETPPPFDKKDPRILSVPFHVQQPDFQTLQEIHQKVSGVHLIFSGKGEKVFDLNIIKPSIDQTEDDW
ncbi:hypothetical protein PBT90_07340 [Algoriphagus halophytocola]|uniref:VLRF1 domain-containing protein n=1 Tax=Algoriphagus halophytocola TaxID=2991499 RepID=A0ABY6MHD3_9BACT|nr:MULTISPECIES: hypothetical protein [unclassified Algoriphagus]UZD23202.1 hypothetical protein OM944_01660 [Algoriphagus sp. TR-M5]WBL44495.1 hypothetical protein PBT90_07340 [Algoriphagus sp. TR-M9]